jgi:hypothetical protein
MSFGQGPPPPKREQQAKNREGCSLGVPLVCQPPGEAPMKDWVCGGCGLGSGSLPLEGLPSSLLTEINRCFKACGTIASSAKLTSMNKRPEPPAGNAVPWPAPVRRRIFASAWPLSLREGLLRRFRLPCSRRAADQPDELAPLPPSPSSALVERSALSRAAGGPIPRDFGR